MLTVIKLKGDQCPTPKQKKIQRPNQLLLTLKPWSVQKIARLQQAAIEISLLHAIHCILCVAFYTLHPMLCIVFCALHSKHLIICIAFHELHFMYCVQCIVYIHILYILHYVLGMLFYLILIVLCFSIYAFVLGIIACAFYF